MARRLYPIHSVQYWRCYDIEDICTLFKDFELHAQTIRAWIKKLGLKTIDHKRPTLIYGNDLADFLKKQNVKHKCKTVFNEMFCMKCKQARPVLKQSVMAIHESGYIKVKGQCRTCKTIMNKSYKIIDWPKIKQVFHVVDVLELYDCADSSVKTHLCDQDMTASNESLYGTPYGDLFE